LTFYFFIVVVIYSLLVSHDAVFAAALSSRSRPHDLQISFVMEAFFLHYKQKQSVSDADGLSSEDSDIVVSEKIRLEYKQAFAIV
jgi:membrane-bound acyltransferase YfiQ involved in biofilm formation